MTLVELMVSLAVTALVMAAAVSIFSAQHRNYVRDRSEKEVFQDTVDVLRVLQRDLLEAGWAVAPNMAFLIRDGGDNSSDEIYINDVDLIDPVDDAERLVKAAACPGCLKVSSISGSTIALEDPWEPSTNPNYVLDIDGDIKPPDNKTDIDIGTYLISDATGLDNKTGRVVSLSGTSVGIDSSSLKGTLVAPAIYYCVDGGSAPCHPSGAQETFVLRRNDRSTKGKALPIADNVVDLQVAYQDDSGNWYGQTGCSGSGVGSGFCERRPFEPSRIKLIRLSAVVRSPTKDKDRLADPAFCRPAVENRSAGTGPHECGYQYKVYTVLIYPRNT
ncbi:MAG: hypothetical protein WHS46_01830 [Desulfosoma sp.]